MTRLCNLPVNALLPHLHPADLADLRASCQHFRSAVPKPRDLDRKQILAAIVGPRTRHPVLFWNLEPHQTGSKRGAKDVTRALVITELLAAVKRVAPTRVWTSPVGTMHVRGSQLLFGSHSAAWRRALQRVFLAHNVDTLTGVFWLDTDARTRRLLREAGFRPT